VLVLDPTAVDRYRRVSGLVAAVPVHDRERPRSASGRRLTNSSARLRSTALPLAAVTARKPPRYRRFVLPGGQAGGENLGRLARFRMYGLPVGDGCELKVA